MTLVIKRRNRKTGTEIALHREVSPETVFSRSHIFWSTECYGHGLLAEWDTRREAEKMMAKPDEWCVGCIEGWPKYKEEEQNEHVWL